MNKKTIYEIIITLVIIGLFIIYIDRTSYKPGLQSRPRTPKYAPGEGPKLFLTTGNKTVAIPIEIIAEEYKPVAMPNETLKDK
jgi:hypothetical protein